MKDGDGGDLTPFWVQSTTNGRRADRLHRHVSAAFFSSGLVIFLLLVTAVFFLVFVVPSSLSFSAQIFKPNSVKKSWDSLNVLLVLVAVVFGFLSRNNNEEKYNSYYDEFQASPSKQNESQKSSNSNPSTPNNWYKYNYATTEGSKSNLSNSSQWYEYSGYETKLEHKNSILARNSNSYPDLRDFSTTNWSYGDYYQRRYYDDDIHVDSGRARNQDLAPGPAQVKLHRRHRSLEGVEHLRALPQNKTVIVDTLLSKSKGGDNFPPPETEAAAVSSPEMEESAATGSERSSTKLNKDFEPLDPVTAQKLPQPPPTAVESLEFTENPDLTYESVGRKKERSSRKRNKKLEPVITPPPQADLPSPSPPRQKSTHRKRGGATGSSTKYFLNSLYHKKKKKLRQKSVDNLDPLLHEAQVPLSSQLPPPSHPPPPSPAPPLPSPSVFQNLFSSKKQKRKRTITVTLAPQSPSPPLPPPPPAVAREPEPTSQTAPATIHKPPTAKKMTSFNRIEETSNSGSDSPQNRIPPPPPPPPPPAFLKGTAWKFVVQGDYVRVNSSTSSRSGYPDTDDGESDVTPSALDAGGAASFHPSPLFCPSPDVDTKAESFITNFRAKLKLEKIHSMREKDVGLSGLGPGPGPS